MLLLFSVEAWNLIFPCLKRHRHLCTRRFFMHRVMMRVRRRSPHWVRVPRA
jgi:hypothetical protein